MLRVTPRIRALRDALAGCGYSDTGLVAKLGSAALPNPRLRNLPRLLYLASGDTHLEIFIRLFLLGVAVDAAAVPFPAGDLAEMGLVEPDGGQIRATVTLTPYGDLLFAADHPARIASGAAPDVVMGVSATSTRLERFTIRKPFRSALDLGTGNGFQAMLAARHCAEAWGVDQCPRAIEFARFNLALNGIENVHLAGGDMFGPVAGRRFDLITGNLPFVIAPGRRFFYRDSGLHLDGFARNTVTTAAEHLEDGGYCQLICEWVEIQGEDWRRRLAGWFEGTGCDAWVLQTDTWHPLSYAENWIRDSEPDTPGHAERLFAEWARYYADAGVASIMTGFIALRRNPGGGNWVHIDETSGEMPADAGELVVRGFALCDFERAASDERLLATRLRLTPDAVVITQSQAREDSWRPAALQLRQAAGWGLAGNVDGNAAALLARCDGRRTLGEAIGLLAMEYGAAPERLTAAALPLARHLLQRGFLLPDQYLPATTS